MGRDARVGDMSLRRPIAAPAATESRLHRVLAAGLRLVAPEEAPLREEAPTAVFGALKSAIQKHKAPKEELVEKQQQEEEEEEEGEEETGEEGLRLLVLDFDGTMTRGRYVAGGEVVVAASTNLPQFKAMAMEDHLQNFGGKRAVNEMKTLFGRILERGIEMRILSFGKKEAIVIALEAVGLAEYFTSTVEGGDDLCDRVYGTDVPPLNDPLATKGSTVSEWLEDYNLASNEVAFLDDQVENVNGDGVGVALILDAGLAVVHEGPFSSSQPWIELVCGLESVAPEKGSHDDDDDDDDDLYDFDGF